MFTKYMREAAKIFYNRSSAAATCVKADRGSSDEFHIKFKDF